MRITAVKGWYVLDDDRSFTIGRCHASDLAEAVALEHSCQSSSCSICRALEARFPVVAADLFSSGMESPLFAAIDRAHRFNRTTLSAAHLESEWQDWLRYWGEAEAEGRIWQCLECDVFNWDSDLCSDCGTQRPVWRLTHAAYCGMVNALEADVDAAVVRAAAADAIRAARRRGFEVAVRETGTTWEILEPDHSVLVPDECGVLSLEIASGSRA